MGRTERKLGGEDGVCDGVRPYSKGEVMVFAGGITPTRRKTEIAYLVK